jgi:DNA polymerase-3 subunit gamma/tau
MSYQVLARKYRPAVFSEMVGQEHVLRALINALDQNRLHHAYLFAGTRGVGKTTIARILAKCLNCETGLTSAPCGECSYCQEISEGRSIDLIEVDAASRTGVDDTRDLLENVQYMPTRSRFKVYLIDEVHMFSKSSFNALLKTLEEPPEHVKFLLATTDPKKLPVTVLSRCLQFNLRNMTPESIFNYLQTVLVSENVEYEESAVWQLGRAADGSMRDALSLTDQAIAYGKGFVGDKDVLNMLGGVDQREVYRLLEALIDGDAKQLLDHIREVAQYSPDYAGMLADFLSLLHRIAIVQAVPDAVDNSQGDRESVAQFASRMPPEDIHLYYQIGLIGQRDLPLAPDAQNGFEMTMLRMLAFKPRSAVGRRESGAVPRTETQTQARPATQTQAQTEAQPEARPAAQTEVVAAPVKQTSHITAMLANIKGESGGSDSTKKPETVSALPEEKSGLKVPESVTTESISTESNVPYSSTQEQSGSSPVEALPESHLPSGDPPEYGKLSDPNPEQPEQVSPEQVLSDSDANSRHGNAVTSGSDVVEPISVAVADWLTLLPSLELSGVAYNLASNCVLEKIDADMCCLRLSEQHASLWNKNYEERIARALSQHFDSAMEVEITLGEQDSETPAQYQERIKQEQIANALVTIQHDENVKRLLDKFDGKLVPESVRPT